jgi:adenylate kinase family enzyme
VYGPSGSGKTTVSGALANALGLARLELDAVFHARPGWDDLSEEDFRAAVSGWLDDHRDGWVADGNYSAVRGLLLPEADAVVWLRLPFRVVYPRLAWRTLSRARTGAELWGGNRESWRQTLFSRDSMLLWGVTNWRRSTARTAEALRNATHGPQVVELRSTRDVARLLRALSGRPLDGAEAGSADVHDARGDGLAEADGP